MGVTSTSKEQSLRLYNGRGVYNEWTFVAVQRNLNAGAGGENAATPGGTGGRAGQGGRGSATPGRGGGPQRGTGPQRPGGFGTGGMSTPRPGAGGFDR
jgi:hypothetical protein